MTDMTTETESARLQRLLLSTEATLREYRAAAVEMAAAVTGRSYHPDTAARILRADHAEALAALQTDDGGTVRG